MNKETMKELKIKNYKFFIENGFSNHDKIMIPLVLELMKYNKETDEMEEVEVWYETTGTATEILQQNPERTIAWYIMEDYLTQAFEMAFGEDVMKNITISIVETNTIKEHKPSLISRMISFIKRVISKVKGV